jgi:hypothetical protein
MKKAIFTKIFNVIDSCTTKEQLKVAKVYLELASKNGYIDDMFKDAIYYQFYLAKLNNTD